MSAGWKDISHGMRSSRPVWIVGVPRSGTTALRRTLAHHPAFLGRSPRGPETRVFLEPRRVLKILEPAGDRLLRYFLRDEAAATRMLEALGGAAPRPTAWSRATWRLRGAPRFVRDGHADLVRVFFHFAMEARGGRRILEKTPQHLRRLREIRATFPRSHVVLCVRHPVDVLSSFRKRKEKEEAKGRAEEDLEWMGISNEGFVERFADEARRILAERAAHPDRSTLVRYEDLTADPRGTLSRLCADLGEPFDEAALLGRDESRDAGGAPRPEGRIVANSRSFEPWLRREEAALVERGLRDVLPALGYTPRVEQDADPIMETG